MKFFSRGFWKILPLSIGGVVLGHIFNYRFLWPDESIRHAALHSSGHGYFPSAMVLGVAACIFAAVIYACLGYSSKKKQLDRKPPSFLQTLLVLFAVQTLLFVYLEFFERFAPHGINAAVELFNSPILPVGIIFQFLTACLLGFLACLTYKIGRAIANSESVRTSIADVIAREKLSFIFKSSVPSYSIRPPPLGNC